MHLLSLLLI